MTLILIARFHIRLINQRWYKDQLQGIDISDNGFVIIFLNALVLKKHLLPTWFLQPSFDANQIREKTSNDSKVSKVISKKWKFGELFGIKKKIMANVVEESNEDTYHKVLEFFQSIQQKILWQGILESNSRGNLNIQNDNDIIKI